jgi:glycine cleavage system H protein
MSDELVFWMGKFEARFPRELYYARNHMWAREQPPHPGDERRLVFGFTAYAVRLLQDVYFLEWMVDPGTRLRERQEIGAIESSKAESALYAPMSGVLLEFNEALLRDPSAINVDKYGAGWLFAMQGSGTELLTAAQYLEHLETAWQVAQRTIKGQMND